MNSYLIAAIIYVLIGAAINAYVNWGYDWREDEDLDEFTWELRARFSERMTEILMFFIILIAKVIDVFVWPVPAIRYLKYKLSQDDEE